MLLFSVRSVFEMWISRHVMGFINPISYRVLIDWMYPLLTFPPVNYHKWTHSYRFQLISIVAHGAFTPFKSIPISNLFKMLRDKMWAKEHWGNDETEILFWWTKERAWKRKSWNHLCFDVFWFFLLLLMLLILSYLFVELHAFSSVRLNRFSFTNYDISTSDLNEKGHNRKHNRKSWQRKSWEFSIYIRLWVSLYDNSFSFSFVCARSECASMHSEKYESQRFILKTIARPFLHCNEPTFLGPWTIAEFGPNFIAHTHSYIAEWIDVVYFAGPFL